MKRIILVTGGARSGKSSFALRFCENEGARRIFVATATSADEEMRERIERHRKERSPVWETIEEPEEIEALIDTLDNEGNIVLIDCLTLWLSNILLKAVEGGENYKELLEQRVLKLAEKIREVEKMKLIMVTNEVGSGIVPENPLGRLFRDIAGIMNRAIATVSDEVYFVVSGIPLKIK
ncbi:MAG: bifunctional adenosylcobinamide kinase/adenosylcobinamide-phosphate guanylyltransferase [Nitrospirae bacterium]|nr:MAG: bifunctional adenosylcobinamide kinase/adenosylcobinamide-phosphate guanylyltransferase [Nitrospirota bacterium]